MALREPLMVKSILGTGDQTLTPPSGRSYKIIDYMQNEAEAEFAELLIDRMSVLAFPVNKGPLNQIYTAQDADVKAPLLTYLREKGIFKGLPIADGQTFTAKTKFGSNKRAFIVYEEYDGPDITRDMPNGTEATEFTFMNYGTNALAVTTATYCEFDKCILPAEYPDFPFGKVVPADMTIDLLGISTIPTNRGATKNYWMTYLKAVSEREVLFDRDRVGIYCGMGEQFIPWHSRLHQYGNPLYLLPTPRTFAAGEELVFSWKNESGETIPADDMILGALLKATRV